MVAFVFLLYACFMSWLILGSSKKSTEGSNKILLKVSVVIAFRNESNNLNHLLQSLENQSFSKERFEIIFVNDHSTDSSQEFLEKQKLGSNLNFKILSLTNQTGKKSAIELGILQANYDIIVTTDADCWMGENWLYAITKRFESQEVLMVLGPVALEGKGGFFDHLQMIEFSTLMAMTVLTANRGRPILSNGANCAFLKNDFLKRQPYYKNRQTNTGDDIFLLHSLKRDSKDKIEFCNEEDALVRTSTKESVESFLSQRIRWASKTKNYKDSDTLWMGVLLFAINMCVLILFFEALLGYITIEKLCLAFLFKWILDLIFLQRIPRWLRPDKILLFTLLLSILYPFYSVGIALLSLFYKPKWKGRKI